MSAVLHTWMPECNPLRDDGLGDVYLSKSIELDPMFIQDIEDMKVRISELEANQKKSRLIELNSSEMEKSEPANETNTYRHYKGNLYELLMIAKNSESPSESLVIYRDLNDISKVWARPHDMFFEKVYHNGTYVDRFKKL